MRQEFRSTYPAGTDFFLMLDSARIIAAHMGEDLPDTLGLDDLECWQLKDACRCTQFF